MEDSDETIPGLLCAVLVVVEKIHKDVLPGPDDLS